MMANTRALALTALLTISGVANAGVISEEFNTGSWNASNFETASGTGSAASNAYRSNGSNQRGLLRTVASNLNPSVGSPLMVDADVTFFGGSDIAFLALRSSGLRTQPWLEPADSVYLRIHNFQGGHTGISGGTAGGYSIQQPGDAFYTAGQTIHVNVIDTGSLITATLTNTFSNASFSMSLATTNSYGGHVGFATSLNSSWDNISISHASIGGSASVPAPATWALALAGLALVARPKRRQSA